MFRHIDFVAVLFIALVMLAIDNASRFDVIAPLAGTGIRNTIDLEPGAELCDFLKSIR
jgi:hypothetical protein